MKSRASSVLILCPDRASADQLYLERARSDRPDRATSGLSRPDATAPSPVRPQRDQAATCSPGVDNHRLQPRLGRRERASVSLDRLGIGDQRSRAIDVGEDRHLAVEHEIA